MFYKFIQNFLTKEECDFIISVGEDSGLHQMKSSRILNGKVVEEDVEYGGNKRMGGYFMDDLLLDYRIKIISDKILSISNELNPFNGVTYSSIPKYSFNRYSDGDFLDWHEDKHEIINGATITLIIQLNDNYEGGLVKYNINKVEYSVPKEMGSVFIFDSNITHSVDIIQSGLRYSLNVWPSSIKKVSLI
jgi:Rps23 Pro-64 3,4-dihydroxylase Tpa1-like proline 4-hydroxylase